MSNQRGTFAKRSREMKLKESARAKADRRLARKTEKRDEKGPPIAWDEAGGTENAAMTDEPGAAGSTNESGDGLAAADPSGPQSGRMFDTSDVDR